MFKVMPKKFVLSLSVLALAVGIFLLPPLTLAADDLDLTAENLTPYLERSQIVGTGKRISVYRLPTTNSSGKVGYWDVTLDFTLDPKKDGKPKKVKLSATESPDVYSNKFVPGTYTTYNVACTVTTTVLDGGRMEVALACHQTDDERKIFSASAATGVIAGHPSEPDLLAAGIDQIAGYTNYSWGKVAYSYNATTYNNWWNCLSTGDVMSARQVGTSIVLSGYDDGNIQKCGVTLVKQE